MRRAALAAAAALALASAPLLGQQPTTPGRPDTTRNTRPDTIRADSTRLRISPRAAFVRSLLIPGWGQISAGSPKSAAVFIALQGGSDYMLVRTISRLNQARSLERRQNTAARDSIFTALTEAGKDSLVNVYKADPSLLQPKLDTLSSAHWLALSRKKQREDWITLAVFWTLASAADALVLAELSDFPAEVGVEPRAGGGMFLRVALPVRKPW